MKSPKATMKSPKALTGKNPVVTPMGVNKASPKDPIAKVPSPVPTTKIPGMAKPAPKDKAAKVPAMNLTSPYGKPV